MIKIDEGSSDERAFWLKGCHRANAAWLFWHYFQYTAMPSSWLVNNGIFSNLPHCPLDGSVTQFLPFNLYVIFVYENLTKYNLLNFDNNYISENVDFAQ